MNEPLDHLPVATFKEQLGSTRKCGASSADKAVDSPGGAAPQVAAEKKKLERSGILHLLLNYTQELLLRPKPWIKGRSMRGL